MIVRVSYLTNVRGLMKRTIFSLNDIWKLFCFCSKWYLPGVVLDLVQVLRS